jgi:agmatine deiminase
LATPRDEGFHMPAEWAPHTRCWMAWPCRQQLWGEGLDDARRGYAAVAQTIARFEPVTMIAQPDQLAQASLYCGPGIAVLPMPHDDSWTRDTGPTFLTDGKGTLAGVAWRFNGWGELYADYGQDAQMARRVLEHLEARRFTSQMVLEGGAIHVDGEGTVLTTEQCLLNPNRNPDITKAQVEQNLRDWLGVSTVIWLPEGIEDDETDGHVDEIACFVRPGVVLALSTDDKSDGNFDTLQTNLDMLRSAKDAKGRPLQVIEVPQPARQEHNGKRLSLSYVNFYIANGGVVMPAFDVAEDERAFRIIRDAFPNRRVVQVHARDIFLGGGGIHCITQQQPAP